jgi:hypothetical protein
MKESKKPTSPQFSFGTATRDAEPKKFVSKEMAVVDCFGTQTPKGPNYNVTDKFNYHKGPEWKIGTNPRNTLDTKAQYEHYYRQDVDVFHFLSSSILTKLIKREGSIMVILDSVEIQE